jgi:hypothetical protein
MPNLEFPVLDGIAPSWADIVIRATPSGGALLNMIDIATLSSGSTLEVGEQRGASGGRVLKRTTGALSSEGSMSLYRSGFQKFLRNLKSIAPVRGNQRLVSLVHFDIQVQHTPPGDTEVYEYVMKGCRYMGRTAAHAEGTEPDQVECPLSVLYVADIIDGEEVVVI